MSNKKKNNNYVTEKAAVTQQKTKKAKISKKTKEIVKQVLIITLSVLLIAGAIVGFWFLMKACSKVPQNTYDNPSAGVFKPTHTVSIKIKGYDDVIDIDLYGDEAPVTVAFLASVLEGYKDKEITISSSASDKFVTVSNGEDKDIKGEFYQNGADITNNVSHVKGAITMHKTGVAQSSGYDFDILLADDLKKNGNYAAVGFIKESEDLEFIQKLVDEYRASKTASSTTATSTELFYGTNSTIKVTADELATEHKTIIRTFTPKTTGTYKFTSSDFKTLVIKLGENEIANKTGDDVKNGFEVALDAGKEYTVVLGVEGLKADTQYKVIISGKVMQTGDNSVEFSKGEETTDTETKPPREVTYKFTAPSTSTYIFKSKDGKVTIKVFDGDKEVDTTKEKLVANKTYDIVMTVANETTTSYVVSITEKTLYTGNNTITITADDKKEGVTYTEYVFASEKTGTFTFELFTTSGSAVTNAKKIAVYNKDGNLVGEKYAYLNKDQVYTVRVMTEALSSGSSYRVTVSEPVLYAGNNEFIITKNEAGENENGTAVAGKNEAVKFFTADHDGNHVFSCTTNFEVEIFDMSGNKLGTKQAVLEKGKMYTIKLVGKVGTDGKQENLVQGDYYHITVIEPVLAFGSNEIEVVDNEAIYEFTASATGIYSIKEEKNALEDGKLEILDSEGKAIENADTNYIILEKDKTYQIKITKPEADEGTYVIVIDEALPIIESVTVTKVI